MIQDATKSVSRVALFVMVALVLGIGGYGLWRINNRQPTPSNSSPVIDFNFLNAAVKQSDLLLAPNQKTVFRSLEAYAAIQRKEAKYGAALRKKDAASLEELRKQTLIEGLWGFMNKANPEARADLNALYMEVQKKETWSARYKELLARCGEEKTDGFAELMRQCFKKIQTLLPARLASSPSGKSDFLPSKAAPKVEREDVKPIAGERPVRIEGERE